MLKLILIFVGSGLGGILRYAVQGWVQRLVDVSFPLGTLAVNVRATLVASPSLPYIRCRLALGIAG